MNNEAEDREYIYIPDDDGNEEKFEVIYQFDAEGKHYLLVIPADLPEDGKEAEVYAFRYEEDNEGLNLFMIEDDQEWDMIEEVLNTLNHELYQ